jgi:predicted DNA-binding antitoxin AbrB/MazE fold protein
MYTVLDFKLSPCSVLSVSTFGCFPGVWFILADVLEPSVRSIFKGLMKPLKVDLTEGSETSANINQTPGTRLKVDTLNTEHGESLKSRVTNLVEHQLIFSSSLQLYY